MRRPTVLLLSALLSSSLYAQAPWIDEGKPLQRQVEAAKRDDVDAAEATRVLIGVGYEPGQTVQTVARVYGGCEDLKAAVSSGVGTSPQDTQLIMESVVALEKCVCTGRDIWPQQRLDGRLRIASWRQGVSFAPASACIAAAAREAVLAAPDKADDVLKGVIAAGRRGGMLVDSIGQRGFLPENLPSEEHWKRDEQTERHCAADLKLDDDPAYDERFVSKSTAFDVIAADEQRCDENVEDLLIDGLASAYRADNVLVLRNDTDRPIDLELGGYVADIYHAGTKNLARRVGLNGIVAPGEQFVVGPERPSLAGKTQLTVRSANFSPGDTVALRRGSFEADCSGVPIAVGSIANAINDARRRLQNASEDSDREGKAQQDDGRRWLEDTAEDFEQDQALRDIDSIGQIGAEAQAWLRERINRPFTLTRNNDPLCAGRTDIASAFSATNNWNLSEGVAIDQIGSADVCQGYAADVVIAKYQNDAENFRVVELLNNMAGGVDLEQHGYLLEIYAEGAAEPTATVALKGKIDSGDTLVITDDGAPSEVRERAQLVVPDLRQIAINALVLTRVTTDVARRCTAEVLAVTRDVQTPVAFLPIQQFPVSREPINDDQIGRGGPIDIASPN